MSDGPFPDKRPRLFVYSLLLPALWFGTGFLMLELFPGKRLGVEGLVVILWVMVWVISWHFAKNFGRHFSKSERYRLIICCVSWAAVAEALALYAYVSELPEGRGGLGVQGLLAVVAIIIVLDTFIIWAAFTHVAKRLIEANLRKNANQSPNNRWRGP